MKHLSNLNAGVAFAALGLALCSTAAYAQAEPAPLPSNATPAPVDTEIVVTGSRLAASPNQKSVAPVTSVSSAEIAISGTEKAEDLLNQLPQVVASQSSTLSNGSTGTSTVSLRGLGADRTLVLINGRRLINGDPNAGNGSAADLNFIPLSLVKRVDVLTGGASATYGADAVAGVVNFVIDKDFTGFKMDVNDGAYQNHSHSAIGENALNASTAAGLAGYGYPSGSTINGNNFDATLAWGGKFGDGRGHVMAYGEYRSQAAITQNTRDYSACSLSSGTACGGSATSGKGNALYYTPASGSSSTIGALGAHTLTTGSATRYNYAPTNYFQRPDQRVTAGMFADYDVSPAFHPYVELMFMSDHSLAQIAPSGDFGNTTTINCNNPLLSAQQQTTICNPSNMVLGYLGTFPVTAGFATTASAATLAQLTPAAPGTAYFQLLKRNTEGGARIDDLNHKQYRAVIGADGDLGKAWKYSAYYQFGEVAYNERYINDVSINALTNALDVVTGANGQPVCASATAVAAGCVPYDVFSGAGVSNAALNYITGNGTKTGINTEQVADGSLSGDLGEYGIKSPLASSGVLVNFGGEFRRETTSLNPSAEFVSGDLAGQGGATLPVSGQFNVYELIGETQVPLVNESFIYGLNFDGGIRFSHYKYSNGLKFNTTTWKLGLTLQPVQDITFRGGINRAVRAPNIQEVFGTDHVQLDGSTDPCSGFAITAADTGCIAQGLRVGQTVTPNPAGQYNGNQGGNPNLSPEVAITKSLGVVLTPHQVAGFLLSVDYFDIKIKNAIQTIGADAILKACDANGGGSVCDLINRNAAGSLWLTTSGYVQDTYQNIGGVETKGFDFNATLNHRLGAIGLLSANFDGSIMSHYDVNNGVSAEYNCAGYYGVTCGNPMPKWRHKARVSLTHGSITTSVTWRYVGPVDVDYKNPSVTLSDPSYAQFASHIGGQSYFDLAVSGVIVKNLTWRAGINNIFDVNPPLVTTAQCASVYCNGNTYPGTYDALGRYAHVGATLKF